MSTTLLDRLIQARQTNTLIDDVPSDEKPQTLDSAYMISDQLAGFISRPVVGWKIGASVQRAWERLGLAEPFGGRIFEGTVFESPALLGNVPGVLTIGAEFAFHLVQDMQHTDYTAESAQTAVDRVYPVLELNRPHFAQPMQVGGLSLIADNGVNYGLVLGRPITAWIGLNLSHVQVHFSYNGQQISQGCAADIGFEPYAALAWLANDRARRGDPLRADQWISSGDLIGPVEASPGDVVVAEFDGYGRVEAQL